MKTPFRSQDSKIGLVFLSLSVLIGAAACSTPSGSTQQDQKVAEAGAPPVVVNPRAEPKMVNLSEGLSTPKPVEVFADVKTFDAGLDKVSLRLTFSPETEQRMKFFKKPIEMRMENVGGTTWRARLTNRELEMLAINGESITYQGQILAQNDRGQITMSGEPIEITIHAPAVVDGRRG
jgi:hypothetical protein